MPITPADFLAVAHALHAEKVVQRGEPCDRTTAGRLYYAAYLALRDQVRSAYGNPSLNVDHSPLRRKLAGSLDPTVADIGTRLNTLFHYRRIADYEPTATMNRNQTALLFVNAKAIFAALPQLGGKMPPGIG